MSCYFRPFTEYFKDCALISFKEFETPFRHVDVDTSTIKNILEDSKHFFSFPQSCDIQEHSIEMEMPFLKYIIIRLKI